MGSRRRGRHARTGTEPVTAYSDLRLRLILSLVFVPLFTAGTVLLVLWWASAGPDDDIGRGAIAPAAVVCGVAAVIAIVDLVVVVRRLRRRGEQPRQLL
ncbi:DUF6343 family protein [Streptomyces sp. 7-21]|jgi:hypothetical protein|uniref:DUF6343 family protein n=1 Tax=Streptomyces sp. 7-21 TaxID=2802283 RepID=UPI00192010BE|nr:DUF6343 family protein [Streptomyces sp. 7-21]MBL1067083.1 hypothetical protein [Streptomyces sp. 7-21]